MAATSATHKGRRDVRNAFTTFVPSSTDGKWPSKLPPIVKHRQHHKHTLRASESCPNLPVPRLALTQQQLPQPEERLVLPPLVSLSLATHVKRDVYIGERWYLLVARAELAEPADRSKDVSREYHVKIDLLNYLHIVIVSWNKSVT